MYGNAPRTMWSRWSPPDELNRIDLACRALLVEEPSGRNLLFETGIGSFFSPALRERYGVNESSHVLLSSLEETGRTHEDIDVVVLSHLHFDHAGGLLAAFEEGRPPSLLFPNAKLVVGHEAFARSKAPHRRDRVSFVPELPGLLEASGRLELVSGDSSGALGAGYRFHFSNGHTPGLMLTEVATPNGPILFAADLIPGRPWVRAAITMGYDRFPELLIDEKTALLSELASRGGSLFFTHDPGAACAELVVADGAVTCANERPRLHGDAS